MNPELGLLTYSSWHTPATDYPRTQVGNFRLRDFRYSKGYYKMSGLLDSALFRATKPLTITNLQEKRGRSWKTWMVDDPPHWEAMKFYAEKAYGDVLTTGLGLGLVIFLLRDNPKVESITVIERSANVVDLIGPHIPECNIILDDFYRFMDTTDSEFDTCIIDLWTTDITPKREAYVEAIKTRILTGQRWPSADFYFHGFSSLCSEVWPMSEETRDSLKTLAGGE